VTFLIRSSSHGNNVSSIYIGDNDRFRKVSYIDNGIKLLRKEKEGIDWYCRKSHYKNYVEDYYDNGHNFCRIETRRISGAKARFSDSLLKNKLFIDKAIDHYFTVWDGSNKLQPVHGDLTLDNIIFSREGVVIFDWEHFDIEGDIFGFDVVYLVLSSIYFPYYRKKKISKTDGKLFKELWCYLSKKGISKDLLSDPFSFYINRFNSNIRWKSIVEDSPNKLFPLCAKSDIVKSINKLIQDSDCV